MEKENKKNHESEQHQDVSGKKDGASRLKEIGLKEVSNKTFINLENLTALLEKDFAKLNRTKALGFIQILQREFDVDLNELKTEYLQFDNAHVKPKENYQKIVEIDEDEEKSKKLLAYLLLGMATLIAAYFFLSNSAESKNVSSVDLNVVKNDVVTQEAKESLLVADEVYEKETNDSDEVDLNKVVQEMFKTVEENESNESEEANKTVLTESNESEQIVPALEENIVLEESVIAQATENKTVQKPIETEEKLTVSKKKKKIVEVKNENIGGLYIAPTQKAWVGVIFLDSMKKKDFLIRRTLQLDASKDQIIMVGHKNFKIFNKQLELDVKSKKKGMFLYKDGELREISKREYDRYRGKVRW